MSSSAIATCLLTILDGNPDALVAPFDSVPVTRTRPTSAVLITWVPPSACLSRPTMLMTRSRVYLAGDQVGGRADQRRVRVGGSRPRNSRRCRGRLRSPR